MSTIVGTCTDCIISAPQSPVNTLNAKLSLSLGKNQITRQLANLFVTFDASAGAVSQEFSLTGQQTIVLSQGASGFVLSTEQSLTVTTVKTVGQTTVTNTITVNRMLFLDDSYTSITIQNPNATGSAAIAGEVYYAAPVPV